MLTKYEFVNFRAAIMPTTKNVWLTNLHISSQSARIQTIFPNKDYTFKFYQMKL